METKKIEILKDDFERYEDCRLSGITNMFLVNNVIAITRLSKEKIMYIMKNYEKLFNKFGGKN